MNNANNDSKIVFAVVLAIAINSTLGLIGLFVLSYLKIEVNAAVVGIVGNLTGSLGTLLATARTGRREDAKEPVSVTAIEPLPVTEVSKDGDSDQTEAGPSERQAG